MKKFVVFIVIIMIFGLSGYIYAQVGSDKLSQPFTLTVGDWASFRIESMILVNRDALNAPTYSYYDKEKDVIVVKIYGARGNVNWAKESLIEFWDFIQEQCIPSIQNVHGIDLLKTDFIVIYFDRTARDGAKEIIRMEGGRLLLP